MNKMNSRCWFDVDERMQWQCKWLELKHPIQRILELEKDFVARPWEKILRERCWQKWREERFGEERCKNGGKKMAPKCLLRRYKKPTTSSFPPFPFFFHHRHTLKSKQVKTMAHACRSHPTSKTSSYRSAAALRISISYHDRPRHRPILAIAQASICWFVLGK